MVYRQMLYDTAPEYNMIITLYVTRNTGLHENIAVISIAYRGGIVYCITFIKTGVIVGFNIISPICI